jgi:hypothetical protein
MTSNQLCSLAAEDIAKFPSKEIPILVQAAIALDREIKESQKTLNRVKNRLIEEASKDCADLGKKQEGTTWSYVDPRGETARVSFPEKKLLSSFFIFKGLAYVKKGKGAKLIGDIRELCGDTFSKLFGTHYKPAKAFRELVPQLLPPEQSKPLLKLIEVPSNPIVAFGTGETEAEDGE